MEIQYSGKIKKVNDAHTAEVSKQTGFPSAATHYMEAPIDLHKELTIHQDATFYIRVEGNEWKPYNILHKDVLIVDRSLRPNFEDLALVVQDATFKVMRIPFGGCKDTCTLWGVITYIIHYAR